MIGSWSNKVTVLAFMLIAFQSAFANEKSKIVWNLIGSVGLVNGLSADEFENSYQEDFGGNSPQNRINPIFNLNGKFFLTDELRVNLGTHFHSFGFQDSFVDIFSTYSRVLDQHFKVNRVFGLAGLEFMPYRDQFRSYFGISLGMVYNRITWDEIVFSTAQSDVRKSSNLYSVNDFLPVVCFSTGVELGFDRQWRSGFFAGLVIETSMMFMPSHYQIYQSAANRIQQLKSVQNENFPLYQGFFQITFGLILNFEQNISYIKK